VKAEIFLAIIFGFGCLMASMFVFEAVLILVGK